MSDLDRASDSSETIDAFADSAQIAAANTTDETEKSSWQSPYGKGMTKNMWYFAVAGDSLKPGKMVSKIMLNEPVLVGRDSEGKVFAMRDICPHQAVKLSAGHFDGKEVECPFHGWRFDTAGVCTEVPSLCADQKINTGKICTRSYFCREVLDSVWVYFGNASSEADLPEVPYAPGLGRLYLSKNDDDIAPAHSHRLCRSGADRYRPCAFCAQILVVAFAPLNERKSQNICPGRHRLDYGQTQTIAAFDGF